jgi:3-deoxy-D-manno-octulosonic-acid transferase
MWIHACSMGEFEQARPVMAAVRQGFGRLVVVLSVTSPSVREHLPSDHEADVVTYLPVDTLWAARRFVRLVRPQLALVVRHDIWPNHLAELRRAGVPRLLIDAALSARISTDSRKGRVVGRLLYGSFDYLLATSEREAQRLRSVAGPNPQIHILGDTRYDQVKRRSAENDKVRDVQEGFRSVAGLVLVAGSTWPADEKHLLPALASLHGELDGLRTILVPHEPKPEQLSDVERRVAEHGMSTIRLSEWRQKGKDDRAVLIVDEVGILANLYSVGDVAFVGGGFTTGVHSVLEPAVYGIPVLFGPRHLNSPEAMDLVRRGGGFAVENAEEIAGLLRHLLHNREAREKAGKEAKAMVEERAGASMRIVAFVEQVLTECRPRSALRGAMA